MMKFLNSLIAFFIFITQATAQQNHFIYIQTENKQAFYVRLGDRLLSSSSVGYIVIPKLQNGNYDLNIGFPKNEWPQQKISVTVNNEDAGFVLKNFDAKGWGLFNMQTLTIIMSSAGPVNKDKDTVTQTDGFADVLADVVSTPSIKQKPVKKEPDQVKEMPVTKKVVPEDKQVVFKEDKPAAPVMTPALKLSSTLDNNGRSMLYIDTYENKTDTIRIFIPYDDAVGKAPKTDDGKATAKNTKDQSASVKKEDPIPAKEIKDQPREKEKKLIDIELPNPNSKPDSLTTKPPVDKQQVEVTAGSTPALMINSDCKANASDDDFLKLRKKMAAQKTDENMIVMAKKGFVSKCYTTEQISNLSSLFLKDEGRYNFFDAAYPHVSDTQNFGILMSKLSDEYYINRFKAMIRH